MLTKVVVLFGEVKREKVIRQCNFADNYKKVYFSTGDKNNIFWEREKYCYLNAVRFIYFITTKSRLSDSDLCCHKMLQKFMKRTPKWCMIFIPSYKYHFWMKTVLYFMLTQNFRKNFKNGYLNAVVFRLE